MRFATTMLILAGAIALLASPLAAAPILPDFGAATFTNPTRIDNSFYPLAPGTIFTYRGEKEEDGEIVVETVREHVLWSPVTIAGVLSRVVRAQAWEGDLLVEDTFDWYAQDDAGSVWYMGEWSTAYEYDDDGNLVGTDNDGSWEAGVNGALAGWIMPDTNSVGLAYYQEFAPADDALDEAEVVGLGETVTIGYGTYSGVLRNLETTVLEPDFLEHKLYAPGVGLILILEDLDEFGDAGFTMELVNVEVVPEPASFVLAAVGAGVLLLAGRRRSRRRR